MRSLLAGAICIALSSSILARDSRSGASPTQPPVWSDSRAATVQTSQGSSLGFKVAETDSYFVYGGPGSVLGKFQSALPIGNPDWQGWSGIDLTEQPAWWQPSTFRSPTGTQAMWAGRDAAQEPGWATAPGYGNNWDTWLIYRKPVSDPGSGQTVDLSFVFHQDVEPGFDFFIVEYDSAATVQTVFQNTGATTLPLDFPDDVTLQQSIVYGGNDYGADDKITIRLRVTSDVAWSDEDGYYPSEGAVQVDDIELSSSEGTDFEDFEGSAPYLWTPSKSPFAGLFAKVFTRVGDLDPCRENETPVLGFIDDGTPASNPGGVLWNGEPIPSLGTTSQTWSYGIPGGWVFNYNGGLLGNYPAVQNEVWSPEIAWDLPGGEDNGNDVVGAFLRFDVYDHLPLNNGIFWSWQVRGRAANAPTWDAWRDRGLVYFTGTPSWFNRQQDVTDLLPVEVESVQVALAGLDLSAMFGFPGTDATVAPLFDNVAFAKYRLAGPAFATREIDLFGDSFASTGLGDVSTQAARDLLDCRIDMSRSTSPASTPIRSGDSLIADIVSRVPAATLIASSLHYSLNKNPVFEDAIRPNAPTTGIGSGRFGWDQSEGTVAATQSVTTAGNPVTNRFYFDLPDEGFLYPGDVFEYYLEAVDSDGRSSTLPSDLAGYDDGANGEPYNRIYQIRGLPSYSDSAGNHPELLWWNDFGNRGGEEEVLSALRQIGLVEHIHLDVYATRGPTPLVDNGLGAYSANGRGHGATAAQVAGYRCLLYESGDLVSGLISDGIDNAVNDKGNDVGLLRSWFDTPDVDRFIAHFGDNLAWFLAGNPAQGGSASATQQAYAASVMGVTVSYTDVRPMIGGQTAPHVVPSGAVGAFTSDFVAYGGCLAINVFDNIDAAPGALRSHGFEVLGNPGTTYPAPGKAAGVVWDRMVGSARKVSVTFPFGMMYVYPNENSGPSGLATLLGEVSTLFDHTGGTPTSAPSALRRLDVQPAAPNPFNPRTVLRFSLGRAARGDIEIFDLRGRSVRSLVRNADFDAGPQQLVWDGKDDAGADIASGVYLARYRIDGFSKQQKLVLLR